MGPTLCTLKEKYDEMKFNMSLHSLPQSPQSQSLQSHIPSTPFSTSTSTTLYQSTLFDIFKHPLPVSQNELDEYLAISQVPFNTEPFSW